MNRPQIVLFLIVVVLLFIIVLTAGCTFRCSSGSSGSGYYKPYSDRDSLFYHRDFKK